MFAKPHPAVPLFPLIGKHPLHPRAHRDPRVAPPPDIGGTLERCFRPGGTLTGPEPRPSPANPDPFFLKSGPARSTVGSDTIEFGPGSFGSARGGLAGEDDSGRGGQLRAEGLRVDPNGVTPFHPTVVIRGTPVWPPPLAAPRPSLPLGPPALAHRWEAFAHVERLVHDAPRGDLNRVPRPRRPNRSAASGDPTLFPPKMGRTRSESLRVSYLARKKHSATLANAQKPPGFSAQPPSE